MQFYQPRFSSNPQEVGKFRDLLMKACDCGFRPEGFTIVLMDGKQFPGLYLRSAKSGNNAGEGGKWAYYGALKVEDKDGRTAIVDLLDIKDIF